MDLETIAEADMLLGALAGVSNMILGSVRAMPSTWVYFWLKLHQNKTLFSLVFQWLVFGDEFGAEVGGNGNLWWLEVVRDCLREAWFIESIKFPKSLLSGEALTFWQAEVMPLLELNASHVPRLPPAKRRRLDVHDAIFRVSSHRDKLRCLLTAYPWALITQPVEARLTELEQQRREDQETQAGLCTSLGMQAHELAVSNCRNATLDEAVADLQQQRLVSNRRIATLDETVADLRRKRLVSNRRIATLKETVADLRRQVQTLQQQRGPGPAYLEEDAEEASSGEDDDE